MYSKSQKIVFSRNKKWVLTVPAKNQTWVLSWWMFNVYRKGWLIEPVQYIETNCIMLVNKGLFCRLVTSTVQCTHYYLMKFIFYGIYFVWFVWAQTKSALKFHYPCSIFVKRKFRVCFDFKNKRNIELKKGIFNLENKLDFDWLSWEKRNKDSKRAFRLLTVAFT